MNRILRASAHADELPVRRWISCGYPRDAMITVEDFGVRVRRRTARCLTRTTTKKYGKISRRASEADQSYGVWLVNQRCVFPPVNSGVSGGESLVCGA